jgi:hypothetical protein
MGWQELSGERGWVDLDEPPHEELVGNDGNRFLFPLGELETGSCFRGDWKQIPVSVEDPQRNRGGGKVHEVGVWGLLWGL